MNQEKEMTHKPMNAWKVYQPSGTTDPDAHLDTVFFIPSMEADDIKKALIEHDGFPSNIYIELDKR
jgi:hypothetical protein